MNTIKSFFREVLQYRFQAMVISALVLAVGFAGVAYQGGLLYGIDFTGGLRILLEFDRPLSTDEMLDVRQLFSENFSSSKVQTVSLKGEEERRGVMLTVRASGLVDQLSNHLYDQGRDGSDQPFTSFEGLNENSVLNREVLAQNFSVGSPQDDDVLDLSRASRSTIRQRVQSLVNQNISRRVITLLRNELVDRQGDVDLNWANEDEVQTWLANAQADGFVAELLNMRSAGNLNENTLNELVDRFGIPEDRFLEVFRLGGEDEDRLNLRGLPRENLRNIAHDEFFRGKYSTVATEIVEARNDRGLFRDEQSVLSLDAVDNLSTSALRGTFYLSPFVIKSREMISPSIGAELIADAALAILLSMLGILVYLYIRFELNYSVGAIGAIVHDVLITVGLLTLMGIEFNVPVVAAVLTVIGYSLNDTIVNFDRVRENRVLMGHQSDWYDVINRSVLEVLNRTMVTSLTTFISALVLYLYGGIALRGFAITLLIGIVAGTYSSIFVSNVLLFELQKRFK